MLQTLIFLSLYVILQMYGQNRLMDHKWYKFLEKQENWCIVSKESRGRITLPFEVFFFFFFFFNLKKNYSLLACRVVCCLHQSYHSIQISCTNHSIWVLVSFKWCHGIRGLCTMTLTKNLGSFDKHYDWGLCKSLIKWSQDLTRYERCAFIFESFLS